ncbi:hypothetical protein ACN47E_008555 [Coniothyrium glycines]
MDLKNIVILGPGGNVGNAIILELEKGPRKFNITAITRQESRYTPPTGSDIRHRTVDYTSSASLVEAFTGQDAIVNCVTGGATQYDPSKLIIDAAIAAGVKFFFANEFVGYVDSEQFKRLPESHAGAKFRIRAYLGGLAEQGKIAWTSLNGGPFFDMWLMKGPAGVDVKNSRARIYGTGNNPLYWTPLPTIALAAANMLRNPDKVLNRSIYICPFAKLSQNIIVHTLEEVVGRKYDIEVVDIRQINKNAKIALERGKASKAMKGLAVSNQFYEEDCGNDFSHLIENNTVGVPLSTVEDAIRAAIAVYGTDCTVVESMFNIEPCEV